MMRIPSLIVAALLLVAIDRGAAVGGAVRVFVGGVVDGVATGAVGGRGREVGSGGVVDW